MTLRDLAAIVTAIGCATRPRKLRDGTYCAFARNRTGRGPTLEAAMRDLARQFAQ